MGHQYTLNICGYIYTPNRHTTLKSVEMHPNAFQHILSSSGIVQRRYIFTKDQYSILPKQYKYNINIQNDQQTYNVGSKGQLTSMDHPSLRHVAPFI